MWRAQNKTVLQKVKQLSLQSCRFTSSGEPVLAIRREDVNVWERRAPLAPRHVRKLVKQGYRVLVQPSNRRAFPMQEYAKAGASIQEDLSEATAIIGVKQVPIDTLLPDKTYAFFSHTIKAQESNMPLLDAILEKNIRLIDYEKMLDDNGQRVVAFGKYAGVSGMINILHGLGLRLLALGHHTPFMHIGPSHNYRNSGMAKQAIRDAGYEIALGMMPPSLGPLTFVFTGSGNVSQGAQEVFQELPYEYIEPEHLPKVAKHGSNQKIYACVASREDHYVRKDGGGFSAEEFDAHPERYVSNFSLNIAPYASVIINGIYWAPNAPRLVTIPDAKNLLRPESTPWIATSPGCPHLPHRLLAICDISADPGGSIEFMKECTSIDSPFCLYDADEHMNTESFAGDGVLICSIDNMPAQIPREATDFFGSLLLPYVYEILKSDATKPFDGFQCDRTVKDAVIASNGGLTEKYEYISDLRKKMSSKHTVQMTLKSQHKNVLILGAGYVSAPVVDYLVRDETIGVTVAAELRDEIDKLANNYKNVTPVLLEIHRSQEELENLIKSHDVVVSLLPYSLHPDIAKLCIKYKTNMVTASYRTPAMQQLHKAAEEAGITVLNEVGVDPGIDHMLAKECFDEVALHGGKVRSFVSYCGGLPAPEFADNPLRYKFSWSPRGVLLNVTSGAQYLMNGNVIEVEAGGSLIDVAKPMDFLHGFNLEGFPNRDSLPYSNLYNIESTKSLLRGTLRYRGFSEAVKSLLNIGLLDVRERPCLHADGPEMTWKALMCDLMGQKSDILLDSLKGIVLDRLEGNTHHLNCLEELGLFDEEPVPPKGSPLDTLSNYLSKKLDFGPGERDLIVLRHDIQVEYQDYTKSTHQIDLIVYGEPEGYSAMASTVGFTTGIAAKMVLVGEIQSKGMIIPLSQDIYRPILKRLQQEGIQARSKII